jgi:hypothetical protein
VTVWRIRGSLLHPCSRRGSRHRTFWKRDLVG